MYPVMDSLTDAKTHVLLDSGVSMVYGVPVPSLHDELKQSLQSNDQAMISAQESGSLVDVGALYLERLRIEKQLKITPVQWKRTQVFWRQTRAIGEVFVWGGASVVLQLASPLLVNATASIPACHLNVETVEDISYDL